MVSIPQLLRKTGDGLFAIDQEQRIVFWNQAARPIFGLTGSQALGRPQLEDVAALLAQSTGVYPLALAQKAKKSR